ncbi:hypothetical protein HH299_07695, partial [Xanthomonas sp. Kuri4-2]
MTAPLPFRRSRARQPIRCRDAIVRHLPFPRASLLLVLALSGLAGAVAAEPAAGVAQLNEDADFLYSESFLAAHPDQYFRLRGAQARAGGDLAAARRYFRRAARHADKLSQAAYAEMLWNGEGGEPDRALAYAWMDLAAERATPVLLARREHYWAALTAQERERAVRDGRRSTPSTPTTWPSRGWNANCGARARPSPAAT